MEKRETSGIEYIHRAAGEEVRSAAWHYSVIEEIRVPVSFGDVLCVLASSSVGSACCGAGEVRYVLVPGRVISWMERRGPDGRAVSLVVPVGEGTRVEEIRAALRPAYPGLQICF